MCRHQWWFTLKNIHCDISHNALVLHYKYISVLLADCELVCLLPITLKLLKREKLIVLKSTKMQREYIHRGLMSVMHFCKALIWQWKKRLKTEKRGEKLWEEGYRDRRFKSKNMEPIFYVFWYQLHLNPHLYWLASSGSLFAYDVLR